ncbi:MAG: N(4)-(beta-N-acetylglucosaminyl)-L-asparaginase [Bacteroidetes bacterium]|nr:N(4)-(beta-N-acetylglucosaminyl)-L-asparaginase [Bacteroidota bacterium]
MKRRIFIQKTAFASILPLIPKNTFSNPASSFKPISIASGNGLQATAKAMEIILKGGDALDAVVAGVNIVENDPNDNSVGYGGLPNYEGVVELDSSVMHGATHRAGAVAALQNIKNPASVAKMVLERTDHVLIVGEGALKFARMHGFKEENLLTEESRKEWVKWREMMSKEDDYLPPHSIDELDLGANTKEALKTYGTINCLGLDLAGNISGVTTTSGLSYKIPGRVGDSPIIGAGLYVDNEVGAAGSTGRGEANLLDCSSFMIVEFMRQGLSPTDACLEACKRIATHTKEKRLLTKDGKPNFNVSFYAINKKGGYGSAAIYEGIKYAVNDGKESRLETAVGYFKR